MPLATDVLDNVELAGAVATTHALHTVKATAGYTHARDGFFLPPVKQNRAYAACHTLPFPCQAGASDRTPRHRHR